MDSQATTAFVQDISANEFESVQVAVRTISEGFRQLRGNLEITDLQGETVSGRQQSVREVVEDALIVLDTFLTGSYRRNTMIAT